MKRYNPIEIEAKWQKKWDDSKLYEVKADHSKQKMYISGMFPYPSGAGPVSYTHLTLPTNREV